MIFFIAKIIFTDFRRNMRFKTYLLAPTKCFIPKCQAHCCTNAPLPENFLAEHKGSIQRKIYSAINIGRNSCGDTFNSVRYNTTPNPIQIVGIGPDGKPLLGIPGDLLNKLGIKSKKQLDELIRNYEQFNNYCPFITDYGKCSVYAERPPICREFGTLPTKINRCPDKSSRFDIAKYYIKDFFKFYKNSFLNLVNKVKNLF